MIIQIVILVEEFGIITLFFSHDENTLIIFFTDNTLSSLAFGKGLSSTVSVPRPLTTDCKFYPKSIIKYCLCGRKLRNCNTTHS